VGAAEALTLGVAPNDRPVGASRRFITRASGRTQEETTRTDSLRPFLFLRRSVESRAEDSDPVLVIGDKVAVGS
jgi:hypothetical protein